MPIVNNIDNVDKYNHDFEKFDYDVHGEYGIVNRRYFTKLDKETNKNFTMFMFMIVKMIKH